MRNISYKVALGGIISALCLITMFFAGIMPALYLLLPMITGTLIMLMVIEVGVKWAFLTYLSVSLLSMFVVFDKEVSVVFIMLFGHYPIIRYYLQKIRIKFIRRLFKLFIFNLFLILYFWVTIYFLGLVQFVDELNFLGKYGFYVIYVILVIIFALYDVNLDFCYLIYKTRLFNKLNNKL